ncbi:unnamed protein product [Microthlaspi erraticum]|uniref:Uncharacterized protein n=1 Tax=Microthlaspi erraticum TaxID=1685480 RepID=A0A6D2HP82_9BRAS|nr:unnamed protein product [Microthlaspi erraticum]
MFTRGCDVQNLREEISHYIVRSTQRGRFLKVQSNPDEVAEIKCLSREELKELVKKADAGEEGLKLSPWFRLVVDTFLMKWWDHVEKGILAEAIDMKIIHKL